MSTAMMAITTSSSISVKPRRWRVMASLLGGGSGRLLVVLARCYPQQLGGLGAKAGGFRALRLLALDPRDGLVIPLPGLFFLPELPVGLGQQELGLGGEIHRKPQ